ncbi:S41 family peptidase [Streptomyces violascens]|uniref:S41 family peptidase n=1 Tax=Streptomyces violascens TaxID=67381 RepID=UPI0036A8D4F7
MRTGSSPTRTVTAVIALALASGAVPGASPAEAAQRPALDGFWRMDGYGTVLSFQQGTLDEYQTTGVSCLKGESAQRSGPTTFETGGGQTVFRVRPGVTHDHAALHIDGSVGDRGLRRIAALPDTCRHTADRGPVATFDTFWQTFEENYPFFAAKHIDWHAVRDAYRPKVHPGMSDDQLFAVFRDMVAPLYDGHVVVSDGGHRFFGQGRPGTVVPGPDLDTKIKAYIQRRDLGTERTLQEYASGRISYADLPGGQGYLRISAFSGLAGSGATYAADRAELDKALDGIFTSRRTAHLRGLILDLRFNGGGSDDLGLRVAERLTDRPYFAYAKRVRNNPADPSRHTTPQPVYVRPSPAPRYTGPVAVLTGGSTFSAGETFTQALMDRPGRTVRVGESTQGLFSDALERTLPNGWTFSLPNEEFLTRAGKTFDGKGIPPQYDEPVFTQEEFDNQRDSAFDRAVALMST